MPQPTLVSKDTRNWTDQPTYLYDAESLCVVNLPHARQAQVLCLRRGLLAPQFFVSCGNLFGSQTVEASNATRALALLGELNLAACENREVFLKKWPDCRLVPNAKQES